METKNQGKFELIDRQGPPFLSVIIPAYNESGRIGKTLEQIRGYLALQPFSWEIILADDGSKDNTVEYASKFLTGVPHHILTASVNGGKGSAVRRGMLAANGDYLLFTDADLSTPIEEVDFFLKALQGGYDIVIGSRGLKNSNVQIRQGFLRQLMGKVFNRIIRLFSISDIHDSQCGFKCFTRKAAKDLFEKQKTSGFGFDVEILFLAQKKGYKILESPVVWRNSPQSRVSMIKDPVLMFWDVLRIHWLHRGL